MKRVLIALFAFLLSVNLAFAATASVSTDKSEYTVGDTVAVSSAITAGVNETISNATITIRIEQAGSLIKETTASGSSASYNWVSDKTGTIDIKSTATFSGQTKTAQTSVSIKAKAASVLTAALTGIKDQYYPAEQSEARVTVTDETGKVVTGASVSASLLQSGLSKKSIYFSYSTLCDCYKGWVWIDEGYLGTYTLNITAKKTGYTSALLSKSFEVVKPTLILTVSTEKSSYYPDEKITIIINSRDKDGNNVDTDLSGEIRDENGFLIENLYPWKDTGLNAYKEDHFVSSKEVGKTLKITINGNYKEQKDSKSVLVSVTQIGLMVEAFIDQTTLKPEDYLTGKIEVKDKEGKIISDAWVDATLYDPNGNQAHYITATYKDGFYILDKKKINEGQMAGDYKLKIKVTKAGDKKEIEKIIKIEKNKIGVNIEFDQAVYKPGDRVYLKILVTDPQGNVMQNAWVSGEIFPLSTETRIPEGYPSAPQVCRIYLSPEGPIYYQGGFIQKYFVDEVYINDWCPIGKYVLRLKVGKSGYEDVTIEKEFEVVLLKLLMETGTSIISEVNSAKINIYAELKDESGKMLRDVDVKGYLHPTFEKGCIKEVRMYFDDMTKRYMATQYIDNKECLEGKYNLELTASHQSYSPVNTTSIIEIKYKEGYEYRELTPAVIPEAACRVISCGPDCFQKTCEREQPCKVVLNEGCLVKCKELKEGKDIGDCVKGCEKRECAQTGSSENEMMKKLEDIQKGVEETKKEVNVIGNIIRSIWNFFRSIFGLPAITEAGTLTEMQKVNINATQGKAVIEQECPAPGCK